MKDWMVILDTFIILCGYTEAGPYLANCCCQPVVGRDLDVINFNIELYCLDATWSPKQLGREHDLLIGHHNGLGSVLDVDQSLQEIHRLTCDCYCFPLN